MIKYGRPDLLVSTLLLPGQCHKDKTFILICLKAKLFHTNRIYSLKEESQTFKMANKITIFYFTYALTKTEDSQKRSAQKPMNAVIVFNQTMQHLCKNTILLI